MIGERARILLDLVTVQKKDLKHALALEQASKSNTASVTAQNIIICCDEGLKSLPEDYRTDLIDAELRATIESDLKGILKTAHRIHIGYKVKSEALAAEALAAKAVIDVLGPGSAHDFPSGLQDHREKARPKLSASEIQAKAELPK